MSDFSRQRPPPYRNEAPLPRAREALSNVGGETWVAGDPDLSAILGNALNVGGIDKDRLTHGFHAYPARMHWATVQRLLEGLEVRGGRILDPFCGSGTVLIEGRVRGASTFGVDLSPFAVRLAAVKSDPLDEEARMELRLEATTLRSQSEELVQTRAKVRADLPPNEIQWYEPHVLKEMAGLFECINKVKDPKLREALTFVFSALVVKFSRQRSDTSEQVMEKRIRKGLVSEFFERKAYELADRMDELAKAMIGPAPVIGVGDARDIHASAPHKVDFIITSPPYGGTYDYADHHARRMAWLGISPEKMRAEIGARRRGDDAERFALEIKAVLWSMRRVLEDGGLAVLLMGDGQHADRRVPADELVADLAESVGFRPVAAASQARPDFRGGVERAEHLMALEAV